MDSFPIEPCDDVFIGVHEWYIASRHAQSGYRHETQQRPIAHQADDDRDEWPAIAGPQHENSGDEITKRDSLGHALETPGMHVQTNKWRGVYQEPNRDKHQTSLKSVQQNLMARFRLFGAVPRMRALSKREPGTRKKGK